MSVGEVVHAVEWTRTAVGNAPYGLLTGGLGRLTVVGTDEVQTAVAGLLDGLQVPAMTAAQIKARAQTAASELSEVAGDSSPVHPHVESALGHLGVMRDKAHEAVGGVDIMRTELGAALGHLAAFAAAMDRYRGAHAATTDSVEASRQAAHASMQSMADYEAAITRGA
jgi:hypothetical protein